jgi:hypothetical protein
MTVGVRTEIMNDDDDEIVLDRCVHFNGLHHDRCKAGVHILSVRDISGPRPYRWPCITFVGKPACVTTCASFRAETQEERDAARAKARVAVEQHLRKLADRQCPTCNTPIGELRQEGRCVYAEPCGHRIGQGDAAVMEAAISGGRLLVGA